MNNIHSACTFALATLLTATTAFAQAPAAPPAATSAVAFDVASIKPSNPNPDPGNPISGVAMILPQPGGRLTANNTPLRLLIMTAYELKEDAQLVGGLPALLAAKYDITAKTEGNTTIGPKELPQLLRTLLADRFKLKAHTESRELPVYDLVIARSDGRLGPDIKPSTSDCAKVDELVAEQGAALAKGDLASIVTARPCMITPNVANAPNLSMHGDGQEVKQLIEFLSQLTGRTVRDKTGLTGRYDFDMQLDLQAVLALARKLGANIPAAAANIPQSDGSTLTTALKDQLGLKLDSSRAAVTVVVIDSVEAPTVD